MSTSFAANFGSFDVLKPLVRCSFNPLSRHTLCTSVSSQPSALGQRSRRPLRGIRRGQLRGLANDLGFESHALCRCAAAARRIVFESRQVPPVQPSSAAMSLFSRPSAAANTILARWTRRDGVLRPRGHFVSVCRSSSVKEMDFATRMALILQILENRRPRSK